jgi:hypothetical protein
MFSILFYSWLYGAELVLWEKYVFKNSYWVKIPYFLNVTNIQCWSVTSKTDFNAENDF